MARKRAAVIPRFRILAGETVALGPGKVALLEQIEATGSIRQAAAALDMSYMRAWDLVRTMNDTFATPLVETSRGGPKRGGANLTEAGCLVLEHYRDMEAVALRAIAPMWRKIERLLRR